MRTVTHHLVDDAGLAALRQPRLGILREAPTDDPDRFELDCGPFRHYERQLAVGPADPVPAGDPARAGDPAPLVDGSRYAVVETTRWQLAIPLFGFVFAWPVHRELRRRRDSTRPPWWAPPVVVGARAATVLGLLCGLTLIAGYLNTVATQTITFAADEFGVGRTAQGSTLAVARLGALVTFTAGVLADRRGRRRLLLAFATLASVTSIAGALAPNIGFIGATQIVSRGSAGATALLIGIVAAEEMPAGARAYAVSLTTMSTALGAGMCVWLLPLADLDLRAWRLLYVVPVVFLPLVLVARRHLPESIRFTPRHAHHGPRPKLAHHRRRLALVMAMGFFVSIYLAPASQMQNEFLRDERGFSAAGVTIFTLVTATPAGLGIVIGGRSADVRGRRLLGAVGTSVGALLIAASFSLAGPAMWIAALAGGIVAGLAAPAMGVFRAELFPTSLRARAGGLVEVVALTGSAAGLVLTGWLADRWGSFGLPMFLVALGPCLVAVLVWFRFPETANRELEDISPDEGPALAT